MKPFSQLCNLTPEAFKRETGLSKENVELLIKRTDSYINVQKERFPEKKRGRNDSKISLADRILLTLYYLRHYPTFANLGDVFAISESYCCKIYHEYVRVLAQIARLPNRKEMLDNSPETLIIDVSEQPIERPVKKQKDYYSGKKKTYNQGSISHLCH